MNPVSNSILVITLSNIGDVVMTTPVFEYLHEAFPHARIDVVGDARSIALLAAAPYGGTLHCRDKRAGVAAQWRLLRSLRRTRYDLVVDLRTPVIPWLLRARRRLLKPTRRDPTQHAVEDHFRALAPLAGTRVPPPCRLHLAAAARERAGTLLGALPGQRWLAVAPGANWPGKRWPVAQYRALLECAAEQFDGAIVLGAPGDLDEALRIDDLTLPVCDLSGRTDLPTAAAALAMATAFVGNDSGVGHIAGAVGTPTLTVFGPGEPHRYRPWHARGDVVLAPQADLAQLAVATVYDRLNGLLARV